MTRISSELAQQGFSIVRQAFNPDYTNALSLAMDRSYEVCRDVQIANGVDEVTDGTVHHLLATGESLYLDVLEQIFGSSINDAIHSFFHGMSILNSFGGVINLPAKPSYVANIHRDVRFHTNGFPLMLNLLIMLDDFTLQNGATYLLEGSHKIAAKPSEEAFFDKAERAVGKRGDMLLFDSNLWHAAGINTSAQKRRAITITLSKPFMKQQLDYPRALGFEVVAKMSDELKQALGYFSRTPTSLQEWYQKPQDRFYRSDQG